MTASAFRLRVQKGPDQGKEVTCTPQDVPVTIGRGLVRGKDLVCSDKKVSRRHASITLGADGYQVSDHGSTNHTRVNGHLVQSEVPFPLRSGDEIQCGPDTTVRFELLPAESAEAPAVPPVAAAGLSPNAQFGPFAVYENLSQGETDRVDVALDIRTGARVALKRFTAQGLGASVCRRLLDEAARAKLWQHPNIAAVVDAGEIANVPFIASRLVDGLSVDRIQETNAADVEVPLALYVLCEVCAALAYAQTKEPAFVHGNLCPRNLMLDYTGKVMCVDFGLTPAEVLIGGVARLPSDRSRYLSPEQRAQRGIDVRSDIYSLGAVLYELVTRAPVDPVETPSLVEGADAWPDVPAGVAVIVRRAMAIRPEARYPTVAELQNALGDALIDVALAYGAPEATAWMIRRRLGVWR